MKQRTGRTGARMVRPLSRPGWPLLFALLLAGPSGLEGQAAEPPGAGQAGAGSASEGRLPTPEELGLVPGRPRVTPIRTAARPVLDGILDDMAWEGAPQLTEFTQQSPIEGAPGTEATDVYLAYDSDNIYVGVHVHYEDVSVMRANRVERDRASADDLVTVYFDTFLDQQRGYDFDINGYGVQGDGVMSVGRRGFRAGAGTVAQAIPPADRSWNALFESGARLVEDGFIAELAIPFKSLRTRRPRRGAPPLGLPDRPGDQGKGSGKPSLGPDVARRGELLRADGDPRGDDGHLDKPEHRAAAHPDDGPVRSIDPAIPAFRTREVDPDAGVNVKYGITSDLTADLTINPDFSQIESDQPQVEVNQRFPLFYNELRPFFLEGAEIFSIEAPVTFVHTRTIVDPDYGAKLSGQPDASRSVSSARTTGRPDASPTLRTPPFGKSARTYIGRVRYELYAESNLGAILTNREFLDGQSRSFGADGNFRLSPTISSDFRAVASRLRAPGGEVSEGHMVSTRLRQNGRNLSCRFPPTRSRPTSRRRSGS